MIMDAIKFSEWILDISLDKKLSQADLARVSGLSAQAISNYFNGNVKRPDPEALIAIAKGLGLQPETVFRAAGLLPPEREAVHGMAELREVYSLLPESDRQELLEIARLKLERQEARKKRRPVARPAEG